MPGSDDIIVASVDDECFLVFESFDDLNLPEYLLRGIYSYGLECSSAIQQRGI